MHEVATVLHIDGGDAGGHGLEVPQEKGEQEERGVSEETKGDEAKGEGEEEEVGVEGCKEEGVGGWEGVEEGRKGGEEEEAAGQEHVEEVVEDGGEETLPLLLRQLDPEVQKDMTLRHLCFSQCFNRHCSVP